MCISVCLALLDKFVSIVGKVLFETAGLSSLDLLLLLQLCSTSPHLWVSTLLFSSHCSSPTLMCACKESVWQPWHLLPGCTYRLLWAPKVRFSLYTALRLQHLGTLYLKPTSPGSEYLGVSLRSAGKVIYIYLLVNEVPRSRLAAKLSKNPDHMSMRKLPVSSCIAVTLSERIGRLLVLLNSLILRCFVLGVKVVYNKELFTTSGSALVHGRPSIRVIS